MRYEAMDTEGRDTKASRSPRRWRQRIRRWIVLYVCIPYLSISIIFFVLQRRLMYRPTVAGSLTIADIGLDTNFARDVHIQTEDGNTLNGWLMKRANPRGDDRGPAPLVVYFPGNSLNRYERINDLREVAARGFDVLIFDYRGFGDSTGRPTESILTSDAQLVWQYACEELQYDQSRIVVFGESLGGAVALSLLSAKNANAPQPAAVILNSTFASMPQTVAWHYPLFPFRYLLLDRWPSIDRIPNVRVPIIVFHGTADDMVPVSQGRALAQAAENARFIEIPGGVHNEIPMMHLRKELDELADALSTNIDDQR